MFVGFSLQPNLDIPQILLFLNFMQMNNTKKTRILHENESKRIIFCSVLRNFRSKSLSFWLVPAGDEEKKVNESRKTEETQ